VDEPQSSTQQLFELVACVARLAVVGGGQRVVVERDAVDDADEQERPVRAALGVLDVVRVVYG
jgi:hypothetical protein